MESEFDATIETDAALRTLYREASKSVRQKKVTRVDEAARRFIEGSPFCLMATADADGNCDVSPRGGPPGFVRVLDQHRLAVPDLSGNNLLDSLSNVVANPHAALLFVIPGRDETLRVEGRACLTTDPSVLGLWDAELRRPKVAIGVTANTIYIHCAKSFRRGRVWDHASWNELSGAPDVCEVLVDQLAVDVDPATIRELLEAGYERDLTAEKA